MRLASTAKVQTAVEFTIEIAEFAETKQILIFAPRSLCALR